MYTIVPVRMELKAAKVSIFFFKTCCLVFDEKRRPVN